MLFSCGNISCRSFYKWIFVFPFVHNAYHCRLLVEMYIQHTCVSGTLIGLGQGKFGGEATCVLQPKMLLHWLANGAPLCLCDPTHSVLSAHVPLAAKSSLSQTKAWYPALPAVVQMTEESREGEINKLCGSNNSEADLGLWMLSINSSS